jgi:CubicO group peptidase (beta-lactamase class C family)
MRYSAIHAVVVLVVATALVSTTIVATAAPSSDPFADDGGAERFDPTDPDDVETWLDETMADQLERHHVPGAVVVVVADGEPLLAKGYGFADLESERPVVADETVFHVGSTGKLVTWTAVMQGVEDGRLALDRDVNDYLDDSPVTIPDTYPQPITLGHLGTHSAGYEDSFAGMLVDDPDDLRSLGELLAANRPARVRSPGEFVAYSNYGTGLAGHVLAEQYGTTFTEYVDERIFTPIGMDDTTYAQPFPERLESRRAVGYAYQDGNYRPQPPNVWAIHPQGGSLKSTGTDMGRFMLAYLNGGAYESGRILQPETVEEMHRRHFTKVPDVPELNGMAYGFIEMDRNDERIVGHWGDTTYFRSVLALFPDRDVGLFAVYNSPGGDAARFELLQAFADRYYPRTDAPIGDPPAGADERAAALTGDYRSLSVAETSWERILGVMTRTFTVEATDDGYLTTRRLGTEPRRWVEREPGVYEAVGGSEILVFQFDAGGRATHLYFGNFGPATYERVPWYESLIVTQGVVVAGALAFVSVLLLVIGAPIWRRVREGSIPTDREHAARSLLGVVSLLWLVVLGIFLRAWLEFDAEVASPSFALQVGQFLPYVALVGTAGVVVAAGFAWREGYWNLPLRVHYSLVTILTLWFTWELYFLRILSL